MSYVCFYIYEKATQDAISMTIDLTVVLEIMKVLSAECQTEFLKWSVIEVITHTIRT